MAYNNRLFKTAKYDTAHAPKGVLSKSEVHLIYDTNRHCTDDYAVNVAIQETEDSYSVGLYVVNQKLGIACYRDYWHYKKDEKPASLKVYNELNKRAAQVVNDFQYYHWPVSIIQSKIVNALQDVDLPHREKSGVSQYNTYLTEVQVDSDWRSLIYGGRYPKYELHTINEEWDSKQVEEAAKFYTIGEGRNKEQRLVYSSETKLAQFNWMMEKIQSMWPYLSTAAIISFLTIFNAKGGTPQALADQLEKNPQVVRSQIPEVEPDHTFQEEKPKTDTPKEEKKKEEPKKVNQFSNILSTTLGFEGGYANNPRDPGRETYKGITRKNYEHWLRLKGLPSRNVNMKNIPQAHVEEFYKDQFWNKIRGSQLPPLAAQQLFDYSVNSGIWQAVKDLQRVVKVKPDGKIGPGTMGAVQKFVQQYGDKELAKKILGARKNFVNNLASKPKYKSFRKGWMKRLDQIGKMIN